MSKKPARLLGAIGLAGCCLLIASCSSNVHRLNSPQDTVDSVRFLTPFHVPEHFVDGDFTRTPSDFDVNTYFTVLDRLSVEPGYVLDYVYRLDHLGGGPIIYARPSNQPAYADYEEYLIALESLPQPSYEASEHSADYLEHIVVEDTAEGYFQFVVLYVLGDQFYPYWHGGYNDFQIVCDRGGLEAALSAATAARCDDLSADMREQVEELDIEPTIEMREDEVIVRFVIFGKWVGFSEIRYTISREFPHRIVDWEAEELLPYDCGWVY